MTGHWTNKLWTGNDEGPPGTPLRPSSLQTVSIEFDEEHMFRQSSSARSFLRGVRRIESRTDMTVPDNGTMRVFPARLKMNCVYRASSAEQADIVVSWLGGQNISAFVQNRNMAGECVIGAPRYQFAWWTWKTRQSRRFARHVSI
jgi:hypothetical protein